MQFLKLCIATALAVALTVSCEKETITNTATDQVLLLDGYQETEEEAAITRLVIEEEDAYLAKIDREEAHLSWEKASCDDCDPEPGEISAYSSALSLSNYERTGSSDQNASSYCSVGKFNTCNNWMVLTSSGSQNHRSELKMRNSVSFQDENIMRTEGVYEYLPSSSSKGLTIGQIHNRYQSSNGNTGRPLLRMELVDGELRAVIAGSYIGGQGSTTTIPLFDYDEGDGLYMKLEIIGDGNKINYYTKNRATNAKKSKTITVNNLWKSSTVRNYFYFKTGAYQQVASSGSNDPRVSLKRFTYTLN